jgi:hypothetical protein
VIRPGRNGVQDFHDEPRRIWQAVSVGVGIIYTIIYTP